MIEEYHFGSITINGKTYNDDVEVRWTAEVLDWSFRERHMIDLEEVKRAADQNPDTIVIGTGESGGAQVTDAAQEEIKSRDIDLIIDITRSSIRIFNQLIEEKKKVIGLFHLTC